MKIRLHVLMALVFIVNNSLSCASEEAPIVKETVNTEEETDDTEEEAVDEPHDFLYEGINYTVLDSKAKTCKTKDGFSEEWFQGSHGEDDYGGYAVGIKSGNTASGLLEIPEEVWDGKDWYKVVEIGEFGFAEQYKLVGLRIPDSVTMISTGAFARCVKLKDVYLSESLEVIGNGAFYRCEAMTSIKFPESLKVIGPDGLASRIYDDIGSFQKCYSLTSVEFPDAIEYIGDAAFYCCRGLKELHLFEHSQIGGLGSMVFACCGFESFRIPDSIREIPRNFMWSCHQLKSLSIPETVERIGCLAFDACYNLNEIRLMNEEPQNVDLEYIPYAHAFSEETFENATLYVGLGCTEKARNSAWNSFKNIVEVDFSGVEEISSDPNDERTEVYRMDGVRVGDSIDGLPSGLYIVREGGKTSKVMVP